MGKNLHMSGVRSVECGSSVRIQEKHKRNTRFFQYSHLLNALVETDCRGNWVLFWWVGPCSVNL